MEPITVDQAKVHLSQLLERVATGEEFVIIKSRRPVAKLSPPSSTQRFASAPRLPGRLKGKIRMADDFDEPLPESIAEAFCGEGG